MEPASDPLLILVALSLLVLPLALITWMGMRRPERTRRAAEAAARALSLPEQPPLHRRMRFFAGRVMDLQVEVASEPQLAAIFDPVPIEHSLTQGLLVRAIFPRPLAVPFRIDSSRGAPEGLDPSELGLVFPLKVVTGNEAGFRHLMRGGEPAQAVNALFGGKAEGSGRIVRAESRGVFVFAQAMEPADAAVLAHAVLKAANLLAERDTFGRR
jgi:hypothetical protein